MGLIENKIITFYSILKTKVDFVNQVKKEYTRTLASDFNSLDFWYVGENKISEILCFLLNPNASHGQEDVFLKLFIEKFEIKFRYSNISEITVQLEKRTDDNRRLDIFLLSKLSRDVIAIENKIYLSTRDQFNQINDYLNYLSKITKDNQFTFIYLAPKDKIVSNQSYDREKSVELDLEKNMLFINYEEHIISLIHQFAISAENERVRGFILDFERKLKSLYMGNNTINDTEVIKNFILENSSNLDLSFQILNNMKAIKADLRTKFNQQMIEIGDELNILFDLNHGRFYLDKLGDNTVGFSFEGGGILYGIVRKSDSKDERRYTQIESMFDEGVMWSYWWPVYFWLFQNIENNSEFWFSINNGSAKKTIKKFILKLIQADFVIEDTKVI